MAETPMVWAVSKTTKQKQRIPAHWLDLAADGIEPFTDFKLTPTERNRLDLRETADPKTPTTRTTTKKEA